MSSDPGRAALELRAARLMAARRVEVAGHVAVTAAAGDVVAVEGVNGSGKSTLLAAAAGLLPAGQGSRHPPTVGYAPERGDTLTTLPVRRWLLGLAQTAGLSRHEAGVQVDDLLDRLGLAHAAARPLRALSRGNLQRVLIAQALIGPPDLLVLDEPGGGLDEDGVRRLTAEIQHASQRSSVVLVARHPTAPVPLPAGPAWRLRAGTVCTEDRLAADPGAEAHAPEADGPGVEPGGLVVETGDGVIRRVSQADLPAVLRAALDAGLPIRRVQPVQPGPLRQPARPAAASPLGRAGSLSRVMHGAAHRARLLTRAQWAVAPALLFLVVLGILYSSDAGPPLQAAAFTAIVLAPLMAWITVLAQRVDGLLIGRAFAAHVGGRGRAHLAACLATVPFAVGATIVAWAWPAFGQPSSPHHPGLLVQVVTLHQFSMSGWVIALHLAAALFGVGAGTLLVPPLIAGAGWRICLGSAAFLAVLVVPASPMRPLLRLAANSATSSAAIAAGLLAATGVVLIALTTFLASRLR